MKCKVSGKNITPFMSFGKMPMANGFITKKNFKNEFFYKLEVGFCEYNYLFQVNNHPKSQNIFNNKYPFFTSKSKFMRSHFKNYFLWSKKKYLNNNSKIVEIGSNDGTFLNHFKKNNYEHYGFEPSKNVANLSKKFDLKIVNDFFNFNNASKLTKFKSNTDLICAANVISHVPDLNDLIKGVECLLSKKGVFIFEEPYLGSMFKKISYDQIYDAHLFIFSLHSVREIFKKFDLELIDAYPQTTHGGSMRYVIGRKKINEVSKRIKILINKELSMNLNNIKSCFEFKNKCEQSRKKFKDKLVSFKKKGYTICGYAASAKSTTLLNYCNINTDIIDYIADSTNEKIGKFSPGMHIPIVPIEFFKKNPADIAILLSWNHKKEILLKEKNFTKNGGKWVWHTQ
jgi:methylation protein EvaC